MRWWKIEVSPIDSTVKIPEGITKVFGIDPGAKNYTSSQDAPVYTLSSGHNGRGQRIVFNVTTTTGDSKSLGNASIQIVGVDPRCGSWINNLNGWKIRLFAGFEPTGMPLGKAMSTAGTPPVPAVPIFEGLISMPYADLVKPNYVMNLPSCGMMYSTNNQNTSDSTLKNTGNEFLSLHAKKGDRLADVINRDLKRVYGKTRAVVDISDIVLNEDVHDAPNPNMTAYDAFNHYIDVASGIAEQKMRQTITRYNGIRARYYGDVIYVTDKLVANNGYVWELKPNLMMGAPSFVQDAMGTMLQVITPINAGIKPGDVLRMPKESIGTAILTSGVTGIDATIKQGDYAVLSAQHVGDSRSPDGFAWASVVRVSAYPVTADNKATPLVDVSNNNSISYGVSYMPYPGSGAPKL